MGEVGCLKDGHFQNLQVEANADLSFGQAVTFKGTATADANPVILSLKTGELALVANNVVGKIEFSAPDATPGSDSQLVCAAIEAVATETWSSSVNTSKLSFKVGNSEAAVECLKITAGAATDGTGAIVTIPGIIRSKGLYTDQTTPVLTVANHGTGVGITATLNTKSLFDINTIRMAGMTLTTIHIDMTGLDHAATGTGKVIGDGTDANSQLLTFSDTTHGQIVRIEMYCNETPVTTDGNADNADIDLCMGTSATSGSVLAGTVQLLTAGGNWAAQAAGALSSDAVTAGFAQSILPIATATNGKLLALAGGAAGGNSDYTAGKFIIKLWGAPVGYIA
tara:strand:- start:3277 stop:4290 length:1014 start_codon:yes stop_codon:yes gene_type:complete